MIVALTDKFFPISNTGIHIATVYKVESVESKSPVLLCIVNLELTIRRYPASLRVPIRLKVIFRVIFTIAVALVLDPYQ